MMTSVQVIFLFFWMAQEFVSCCDKTSTDTLTVKLGEPLTLNCTYNCSTPFVRGCWKRGAMGNHCPAPTVDQINFCTVSLYLSNVSIDDVKIYACYTEDAEDPRLPQKQECLVSLQVPVQTSPLNFTTAPQTESNKGELTGMKILGIGFLTVAVILAALAVYLCVSRKSRNRKGEPIVSRSGSPQPQDAVSTPVKGTPSAQSERVTLRIPPPDNEDDTEVPYADIMITIRGVSTPELTQAAGDHTEWWGDDSRARLQASRSADRLHVPQPREVSRKMSTNSEYAVITYA